jgi:hypothetical protein
MVGLPDEFRFDGRDFVEEPFADCLIDRIHDARYQSGIAGITAGGGPEKGD